MSWVDPQDVINSWIGTDVPTDEDKLQIWIDRAERIVRRRVPDLQARIDVEAELDPPLTDLLETTKDVVVAMVTEVFKNPDGRRSVQTVSGPYTDNITFGGDNPGKLVLLPEQEDALSGVVPGASYSFDLIAGHVDPPRRWPW